MNSKDTPPTPAAELRQQAETRASASAAPAPPEFEPLSPADTQRMLHELRVYQIELEMQNEELRRTQAELEAGRARYFDLFDRAPVGYVTVSEKGLILEANLTAATLLGVARGALTGQPLSRFVRKEDQDIYYRHRQALVATGEPAACELRMVKKDGHPFWAHLATTVSLDATGASVFHLVLANITERKQAAAEKETLESQNRQLQKAESLGRMAGAIAHHFNNKLQAVMGNLEMAMNELPGQVGPSAKLAAALQAALAAAEVSGQMLTYLGQASEQRQPLELAAVCRQSLDLLRAAQPGGVVLEADLPAPGPSVSTGASHIQQVLTNLVTNAWEAMPGAGGCVRVELKTVAVAAIPTAQRFPVAWQPEDPVYACLQVADTGSGIAPENVEKLFDPFFSTKFTGRGLGLSMVLGIVRAHHGAITVETEPGRGSVFRVFLPVSRAVVPPTPVPAAPAQPAAGHGTVLVVDDEPAVRSVVGYALRPWGYTVLEAEDGLAALEVFAQHREEIRCVLCDLTMPRMNGWDTLTALRELSPGIPVILSSGYAEAQVMAGEHPQLPQAFLRKPYELKTLYAVLSQTLKATPHV